MGSLDIICWAAGDLASPTRALQANALMESASAKIIQKENYICQFLSWNHFTFSISNSSSQKNQIFVNFRFRRLVSDLEILRENTIYTILRYIPVRGVFICNNVSKTIIPLLDRTHDQTLLMRSSDVLPVGFNFLADPVMIPAPRLNPFGRLIGAQTQLMITCSAALWTSAASWIENNEN